MSTVPQELYKNTHEYHQLSAELDDSITDIEVHISVLNEAQTARLHSLVTTAEGKPVFDSNEVDKQYHLLLGIQRQLVDMDGQLKASASIRDIASVISSTGSVISLFLKAQSQFDSIKAEADLKQAVLQALEVLPEKNRAMFFKELERLS